MSVNELLNMFEEAENTADYQFESAVVDLTEAICEIMEAKGISRADLARQLGKSRAWVTKVLRGDRNLTLKTIVEILWELGYKASVRTELRWGATDTWDKVDEYETQDIITVYTKAGQRSDVAANYVEQPVEQPMEQKNVVAA